MENQSKNTQDFYRIATVSTCIGFAAMGALFGSVRETADNFQFVFTVWTVIGMLIGIAAGWLMWKIFRSLAEKRK